MTPIRDVRFDSACPTLTKMRNLIVRPARHIGRSVTTAAKGSSRAAVFISRHGAMAATRVATHRHTRTSAHRGLSLLMGSILIGLGVAFYARARLGLPPYDVVLSVVRDQLGISLGQAGWALAAVLLTTATLLGQRPALGTMAYIGLNGFTIDAALALVRTPDAPAVRALLVVLGLLAIAAGISLVVHSGNPGGAFELLMRAGAARGVDPLHVRTGLEVGLLGAGILAGGDFGVATVIFAVGIGPTMRLGSQVLQDHRRGRELRLGNV